MKSLSVHPGVYGLVYTAQTAWISQWSVQWLCTYHDAIQILGHSQRRPTTQGGHGLPHNALHQLPLCSDKFELV